MQTKQIHMMSVVASLNTSVSFDVPALTDISRTIVIDSILFSGYAVVGTQQAYLIQFNSSVGVSVFQFPVQAANNGTVGIGTGTFVAAFPNGTGPRIENTAGTAHARMTMAVGTSNARASLTVVYHYEL